MEFDSDTIELLGTIAIIVVMVGGSIAYAVSRKRAGESEERLAAMAATTELMQRTQTELLGRIQAMSEHQQTAQEALTRTQQASHEALTRTHQASHAAITRTMEERMEHVGKRLSEGLNLHTEKTGETMSKVHERLAVIDNAQKNLTDLSEQMVGLQNILSNKQTRGAFGEIQLDGLVRDILPPSAYTFQATLSNGKRADCLLKLPNPPGAIVIDAKFPLESYQALRAAESDEASAQALKNFGKDILYHVKAISEKYIVPGETAESALMFLPSEAVYAELHASLPNIVDASYKAKVWIVSPTTLMATLNTVRAVLKDARIREQAGVIQVEVMNLLKDVERLDKRVENLDKHFDQAGRDIKDIRTSSTKITSRANKIEDIQLGEDTPAEELTPPPPQDAENQTSTAVTEE